MFAADSSSGHNLICLELVLGCSTGRQVMKVSLSASWRQLRCMEYSSSRDNGSEAVASWIS
jgi:hypothetical protein